MIRSLSFLFAASLLSLGMISCADTEPRPAGPTSESNVMPWNTPVPGQGQGQFGMLPQNQYRR
jgi:hypothetical protein